ncbi:MAG: STT3 domain-containing protein, partial [Myxococcota bacterium]
MDYRRSGPTTTVQHVLPTAQSGLKSMHSILRMATPVLLFVVALATRLISWHSVFQKGGVTPHGNDAYYHLRRIRYSVEHFPDVLHFDPLMNFPDGAQAIWSPTFDWLVAALLRGLPGIDQPDRLEIEAMLIPPILGAITVVLVYFLALRFFSRRVAVLSALSMAVLPAHSLYSRVGALDHHVLVALVVAIMLALAMSLFSKNPGELARPHKPVDSARLGLSAALGASIGAAVLVWPGTLLQVGVLQLGFVVRLLTSPNVEEAKGWSLRFCVVHLVAGL